MNTTINTFDLLNYISHAQSEKSLSLDEAFNMFMDYKQLHNREGTCSYYNGHLRRTLNYFKNHNIQFTNQLDTKIINQYIKERSVKVKNITINKEMINLTAMMHWLIKQDLISSIHYNFEKLPEQKTKIDSIEEKDVIKIIKYFDNKNCKIEPKNKLIFLLILTTGIRTNELCNITNANIDIENKRILLSFTKNKKPRYIYIVDQLVSLVSSIKNKNIYLFNDEDGNQITQNAVRCFFRHLKENLSIEILSPHKLRHYYATNVYKKSLDIYLVSKLLGHSNTKITEVYLDVDYHEHQLKNEIYNPLTQLTQGLY